MTRKIEFTHLSEGMKKEVAIAHIYKMQDPEQIHEYAVVRFPNTEGRRWGYALSYFTTGYGRTPQEAYSQAVEYFNSYMAQ